MIYFRADGNSTIGMGHLMRCFSIANEMKNEKVIFLCADEQSALIVYKNGFKSLCLETEPFSELEAHKIVDIIKTSDEKNILIIDSYLVNDDYTEIIHPHSVIVCMDDIFAKYHEVDGIINYNSYALEYPYEEDCELILGPEYLPLRKEFLDKNTVRSFNVQDILISAGGSDPFNISFKIAKYMINSEEFEDKNIHIICGKLNQNREKLEKLALENTNIKIHIDVKNMSELMEECDLGVSAGGSTCYEMCAMGLPFVVFSFVDNQRLLAKDMGDRNAALYVGHLKENDDSGIELIVEGVKKLMKDKDCLRKMSNNGKTIVDGKGAGRLAERIIKLEEGLR